MLASGGLGIVQKVQQSSAYASEKSAFLLIAFAIAASASLIAFAIRNRGGKIPTPGTLALSGGVGVCFGCCNLLNTTLAGMLASAILFPTLNIGVILLTSLCGLIFLKEKITARVIGVLSLGVASILLLNLS
jgi:drug/metabolite transporter (DMT)-like permease